MWGPHDLTKSVSVGASDFVMLDVMKISGITVLERLLELKGGFALPQKEAGGGLAWDQDAVARYRVC